MAAAAVDALSATTYGWLETIDAELVRVAAGCGRSLLQCAPRRLLERASAARNNNEQNALFEAIDAIRRVPASRLDSLASELAGTVAELRRGGPAADDGLTLVEVGSYDLWSAVASLISHLDAQCRDELFDLQQRFSALEGRALHWQQLGFGPARVVPPLVARLIDPLGAEPPVRQLLLDVLRPELGGALGRCYADVNRRMQAAGVEAAYQLHRHEAPPSAASAAAATGAAVAKRGSAAVPTPRAADPDRPASTAPTTGAPAARPVAAARPASVSILPPRRPRRQPQAAEPMRERLYALADALRQTPPGEPVSLPDIDAGRAGEIDALLTDWAALPKRRRRSPPLAHVDRTLGRIGQPLAAEERAALGSVERVLAGIADEAALSPQGQGWVERLQPVLLRAALDDPAWFSRDDSHARCLLNRLGELDRALRERPDGPLPALLPVIDALIERIGVSADADVTELASRMLEALVPSAAGAVIASDDVPPLALVDQALYRLLQDAYAQLLERSRRDDLTGLLSRREFLLALQGRLEQQAGTTHLLAYLDIDDFRVVNTGCGIAGGDALLQRVARALRDACGDAGPIGRLANDEFAFCLPFADRDAAVAGIERLRHGLRDDCFEWQRVCYPIGLSVGLRWVDADAESAEALLQQADAARAVAKEQGGDRWCWFGIDAPRSSRQELIGWVARVNEAIANRRLALRCQRIAPLLADVPDAPHYEVLLGIRDDLGEVQPPPFGFIRAAEVHHRMPTIDRWVVGEVLERLGRRSPTVDALGTLSVNLSGASLSDPSFRQFLLGELGRPGLRCGKLCFEITETAAIEHLEDVIAFIRAAKQAGCRFSLDDFGSGMASYAYLKRLPVDYLKIDGSLVRDICRNDSDLALVRSISEIGHFMGKRVIAEWAEDAAVLERLAEIGVDYAQGYAVALPGLLDDVLGG